MLICNADSGLQKYGRAETAKVLLTKYESVKKSILYYIYTIIQKQCLLYSPKLKVINKIT